MSVRAVHRVTREVRAWRRCSDAEEWLTRHDDLNDWEISEDRDPMWSVSLLLSPGPDGRVLPWIDGLGPVYDTPDGKPPH